MKLREVARAATSRGEVGIEEWFEGNPRLRFSSCGRHLLAFDRVTGRAVIFGTTDWTELRRFETHTGFDDDGSSVAPLVALDRPVFWGADAAWSMETGEQADCAFIRGTQWAPSGDALVSVSPSGVASVTRWGSKEVWRVPSELFVSDVAFVGADKLALIGEAAMLEVWNVVEGALEHVHDMEGIEGVAIAASPDATSLVVSVSTMKGTPNAQSKLRLMSLDGRIEVESSLFPASLAWSPDGNTIAASTTGVLLLR